MTQNHESLILYFVSKHDYENASLDMKLAFQSASNWQMKPEWMKESDCLETDNQKKGQVFVFEEFEGAFFSSFIKSHTRSRVIGPKCLLTCFCKNIAIPGTNYPVFNMAMDGLVICTSNMSVDEKKELKDMVGYMGGIFSNKLITSTTHLVIGSVLSAKYFKACEQGIPVMKESWVRDIWKKSLVSDVGASDNEVIEEYKAPIFYNLRVTASGFVESQKIQYQKIISDNGGIYTAEMCKGMDILIVALGKGEKFKYAERWKMKCINPTWIECCLKKGYAVPYQSYIVRSEQQKCSTPVNEAIKMISLMNTNDTDISVIPSNTAKTVVADTQIDSPSVVIRNNVFKTPVKYTPMRENSQKCDESMNYQTVLNDISLNAVKKCGPLLDGCKVYLAGFKDNEEEKLRRILNYGGAIRFTELNDSVTHVIVGNPSKSDLQNIRMSQHTPHIVTLDWLSVSVKKGCLEKESNCPYFMENKEVIPQTNKVPQQPSPLSKKGLQMLNPIRDVSANPQPSTEIDHNLIEKYSGSLNPIPCELEPRGETSDNTNRKEFTSDQTIRNEKLFAGLKFAVIGHEPDARDNIQKSLLDYGGFVSEEYEGVDYTVLPMNSSRNNGFGEVVTSVWMEECLSEMKIVETRYYHRPLTVSRSSSSSPLRNCVITFSSYSFHERLYLENVAAFLGAKCQDVLSRKENEGRNIARTTHLVCAKAQGMKYTAAKKWDLPIVTEKWLLDSFIHRKILPLNSYSLQEERETLVRNDTDSSKSSSAAKKVASNSGNVTNDRPTVAEQRKILPLDSNSLREERKKLMRNGKESSKSSSTETSEKGSANSRRLTYDIPTLAEAVKNTRTYTDQSDKSKAAEIKDLPHGLLARINREASSTIKRKADDESCNFEAARIGSPKRKLLCADSGNGLSTYEEVGWQDTFTDIQKDNFSNSNTKDNADAKASSAAVSDTNKESSVNNLDGCNLELPMNDNNVEKSQKHIALDIGEPDLQNKDEKTENQFTITLPRKRTVPLFRNNKLYYNIMISVTNNEKKSYETVIKTLGGRVISRFDPDCLESERVTHLIIDELKKTEKLLCSIANGLWVLHSSYLKMCEESNKFVNEEQFEWGNPLRKNLQVKDSKENSLIAKAAHRWRKLIQTEGPSKRPFVGMRAVIVSSGKDEFIQSLARVVKSGGGIVMQQSEILNATHCLLMAPKNLDILPVQMHELATKRIHLVPAVYLSDCLMNDPPPKPESCYFDPYKRFFS